MSKYLITLSPTGKFFFGGEMTFQVGADKDSDFNNEFSSYIIKSNRFPQQTSLLGMLRFLILSNAGEPVFKDNRIVDKGKAAERIGKESFKMTESHKRRNYGYINNISPCFLMNGDNRVNAPALGEEYDFCMTDEIAFINGRTVRIPKSDFNAKNGMEDAFECYFVEDRRMGINKDYEGKKRADNEEKALYKQINYRFNKDFPRLKFAFYADVDSKLDLALYDGQLVSLGADSSMFVVGISKAEEPEVKEESNNEVILLSPAYLESENLKDVDYAITQQIPFRCLSTNLDTENYNRLNGNVVRSEKLNLYATGSRFFFRSEDKKKAFMEKLSSYEEFVQIGYNTFK